MLDDEAATDGIDDEPSAQQCEDALWLANYAQQDGLTDTMLIGLGAEFLADLRAGLDAQGRGEKRVGPDRR